MVTIKTQFKITNETNHLVQAFKFKAYNEVCNKEWALVEEQKEPFDEFISRFEKAKKDKEIGENNIKIVDNIIIELYKLRKELFGEK